MNSLFLVKNRLLKFPIMCIFKTLGYLLQNKMAIHKEKLHNNL